MLKIRTVSIPNVLLLLVQFHSVLMFCATVLLLGLSGWWLFGPVDILTNTDFRLAVRTPVVAPGTNLVYTASFCKNTAQTATMDTQLVGTVTLFYPPQSSSFSTGCGAYTIAQHIPPEASEGTHRLVIVVTYKANPLRRVSYRFESDPFEIRRGND